VASSWQDKNDAGTPELGAETACCRGRNAASGWSRFSSAATTGGTRALEARSVAAIVVATLTLFLCSDDEDKDALLVPSWPSSSSGSGSRAERCRFRDTIVG